MNAYRLYCYGYENEGDQNPGWCHEVKLTTGIKISSHDPTEGLCFLEGRGSVLLDNKSHCRDIIRAEISKASMDKFQTRHIAKQDSQKVLHIPRKEKQNSYDVLIHVIFDGELLLPYKRVLEILRIQDDQIVSCESSIFQNGERYVFSIVFILHNKRSTEVLFGEKALFNNDGKLEN